jgi:hypothetical protein
MFTVTFRSSFKFKFICDIVRRAKSESPTTALLLQSQRILLVGLGLSSLRSQHGTSITLEPPTKTKLAVLTSGGDSSEGTKAAVVPAVVKTGTLKCALFLTRRSIVTIDIHNTKAVRLTLYAKATKDSYMVTMNMLNTNHTRSCLPTTPQDPEVRDFINGLRFGDGDRLKDGTGDHAGGRTLGAVHSLGWAG